VLTQLLEVHQLVTKQERRSSFKYQSKLILRLIVISAAYPSKVMLLIIKLNYLLLEMGQHSWYRDKDMA